MIRSTIEGTRRVLNYAREAGVKKIVVTGTFGNTHHPNEAWAPKAFSDDDWNPQTIEDAKQPETHPWAIYTASKVIGEREVWKFADANKDIDVTTVLPGFIFGPYGRGQSGTETIGGTFGWVAALIYGEKGRTVPVNSAPFSPNYVHVSDVAALHVAALKAAPAAPGTHKRVLAVGGTVLWPEVSEYLGKSRPQLKDRLGVIPQGYKASIDFAKFENKYASSLFGFRSFKGWEETFGDAVDALLAKEEAKKN
ncbi:hypothetical protein B0F90DRAFT_1719335 [Multifurca ochricompacta]|uniref:NAD-dependent epimerase/dehydratase domain-containing protein n=1 Tax=Multifurca ochricompacta TaxID=376703 RepID=A0AAD4M6A8_9AGAM|nr:hypothetical protein B0F90DRAFT_1719335 [Multifurca ochricompacta]